MTTVPTPQEQTMTEVVEAVFAALQNTRACRESHRREDAEVAVAAALPIIRRQIEADIRERAHNEVELHQCSAEELPDSSRYFRLGLLRAAEIARGGVSR